MLKFQDINCFLMSHEASEEAVLMLRTLADGKVLYTTCSNCGDKIRLKNIDEGLFRYHFKIEEV